ncbi:MAG: hypothetical protein LAT84_02105 [Balneolia bacterium]|nr:hypothetical protein [Balneolia bacterium]
MKHLNQYSLFSDLSGSSAGAQELTKEQAPQSETTSSCLMVRVSKRLYALNKHTEQDTETKYHNLDSYTSRWEKVCKTEQ